MIFTGDVDDTMDAVSTAAVETPKGPTKLCDSLKRKAPKETRDEKPKRTKVANVWDLHSELPWVPSTFVPKPFSFLLHGGGDDVDMIPEAKPKPWRFRLQCWNIQNLGGGVGAPAKRKASVILQIAKVLHATNADVSVIVEIMEKPGGFKAKVVSPPRPEKFGVTKWTPKISVQDITDLVHSDLDKAARKVHRAKAITSTCLGSAKADAIAGANLHYAAALGESFEAWAMHQAGIKVVTADGPKKSRRLSIGSTAAWLPDMTKYYLRLCKFVDVEKRPEEVDLEEDAEGDDEIDSKPDPEKELVDDPDAMAVETKPGSETKKKKKKEKPKKLRDTGILELKRVVAEMNVLGGDCYDYWPKAGGAGVYTAGESYAYIWKKDRCTFEGTQLLDGQCGFPVTGMRVPMMALFKFGTTPIRVVAWHSPSDQNDLNHQSQRTLGFRALMKWCEERRKGEIPCFLAGDMNIATQESEPIVSNADGTLTVDEFMNSLSDDPSWAKTSIYKDRRTSLRTSAIEDVDKSTLPKLDLYLELMKAGITQTKGYSDDATLTDVSGAIARYMDGRQDPLAHMFNAFDKMSVVCGTNKGVTLIKEWTVQMVAALASEAEMKLVWEEVPSAPVKYRGLLQQKPVLETPVLPVETKTTDASSTMSVFSDPIADDETAMVIEAKKVDFLDPQMEAGQKALKALLVNAKKMSDHAPFVGEYEIFVKGCEGPTAPLLATAAIETETETPIKIDPDDEDF